MEYQLSLWQTLAANFAADNIVMSLIVIGGAANSTDNNVCIVAQLSEN